MRKSSGKVRRSISSRGLVNNEPAVIGWQTYFVTRQDSDKRLPCERHTLAATDPSRCHKRRLPLLQRSPKILLSPDRRERHDISTKPGPGPPPPIIASVPKSPSGEKTLLNEVHGGTYTLHTTLPASWIKERRRTPRRRDSSSRTPTP